MPLDKSKSKQAFSENVSKEMQSGKPQNQALAIAYNVKRKMKKKAMGGEVGQPSFESSKDKSADAERDVDASYPEGGPRQNYAKGGEVRNMKLHPESRPGNAPATSSLDHMDLDSMAQNHEDMKEPSEPSFSMSPDMENMGRNNPIGDRIMRAVGMALGGSVDEHDGMHSPNSDVEEGGENLPHGEDENRALALNDTYPPGKAESDTQAQDEMYGDAPMHNQVGDSDQEDARNRWQQSAKNMAKGGPVPQGDNMQNPQRRLSDANEQGDSAQEMDRSHSDRYSSNEAYGQPEYLAMGGEIRDLNKQPREGQMPMPDYNEESMVDQDEARKNRIQRALDGLPRRPGQYSNSNTPNPSGDQRMSNRPHSGKMRKQP